MISLARAYLRISGPGGGTVLFEHDDSGRETGSSPPPATQIREWERAIVQHPIPNRDDDIGQDMGSYSRKIRISGICKQIIKDTLENWTSQAQFSAGSTGPCSVQMVTRDGQTLYTINGLAIKSYSWRPTPGRPTWFTIEIFFVEFHQT